MSQQLWLGFDFGKARIGVAVGQSLTGMARALDVVAANDGQPDWQHLDKLVKEWAPGGLVVGLPLHRDGSHSVLSAAAKAFAKQLHEHYQLPVDMHDERLSSRAAEQAFTAARQAGKARKKHAMTLDAHAAAVILQSYLNELA